MNELIRFPASQTFIEWHWALFGNPVFCKRHSFMMRSGGRYSVVRS
jgi:hypothetical protein